jgi:hypothetical protein
MFVLGLEVEGAVPSYVWAIVDAEVEPVGPDRRGPWLRLAAFTVR